MYICIIELSNVNHGVGLFVSSCCLICICDSIPPNSIQDSIWIPPNNMDPTEKFHLTPLGQVKAHLDFVPIGNFSGEFSPVSSF